MTIAITTLKKRADFLRLNRAGKYITPYFILRYGALSEAGDGSRVGFTVTTKCGNAVVRNRIKRRFRAVSRELFPDLATSGMDYVLIARADAAKRTCTVPLDELRQALRNALGKIAR